MSERAAASGGVSLGEEPRSSLWVALLLVAMADLLLNRLLLRMLIYLPKQGAVVFLRSLSLVLGPVVLNLTVLLSTLTVVSVPPPVWEPTASRSGRVLSALRVLAPLLALLTTISSNSAILWPFHIVGATLALVLVKRGLGRRTFPGGRIFLALTGLSFLSAEYYLEGSRLWMGLARTQAWPLAVAAPYAGETLSLAAAYGLLITCVRPVRPATESRGATPVSNWPLALLVGTAAALAFSLAPSEMAQVTLFGLGFTMFLPMPCYLLALVVIVASGLRLIGERGRFRQAGLGLLLVAVAGCAPQAAVPRFLEWLAGLCLLASSAAEPEPSRSTGLAVVGAWPLPGCKSSQVMSI